ncbi:hypothetical protein V8C26DRAFT_159426 [Trichoderma gracile]
MSPASLLFSSLSVCSSVLSPSLGDSLSETLPEQVNSRTLSSLTPVLNTTCFILQETSLFISLQLLLELTRSLLCLNTLPFSAPLLARTFFRHHRPPPRYYSLSFACATARLYWTGSGSWPSALRRCTPAAARSSGCWNSFEQCRNSVPVVRVEAPASPPLSRHSTRPQHSTAQHSTVLDT